MLQVIAIKLQIKPLIPAAFNTAEGHARSDFYQPLDFDLHHKNQQKLFIQKGTIPRYLHQLHAHEEIDHWSRLFYPRPYERSVFQLRDTEYFLFPAEIPQEYKDRELVFVGRVNVDTRFAYEGRILVEGIALIPYDINENKVEMTHALIAKSPIHMAFLRYNKPKLSSMTPSE